MVKEVEKLYLAIPLHVSETRFLSLVNLLDSSPNCRTMYAIPGIDPDGLGTRFKDFVHSLDSVTIIQTISTTPSFIFNEFTNERLDGKNAFNIFRTSFGFIALYLFKLVISLNLPSLVILLLLRFFHQN